MSKTKGNRAANQISGYRDHHRKYIILILVKHGNKPFISEEQGTGNPLEELHFQGKMNGSRLL